MDSVAIPRRQANNKGNKENTQPDHRNKAFIKREKTSVVPFQLKGNQKEETLAKDGLLKAQDKRVYTRPVSGKNLKRGMDGRGAVVSDVKRKTHSQVFLTEQAVRYKKTVREAPKLPAAMSSSKPAPGMYKGKVVQSKIGSIWKSSDTLASADLKPSAPKAERKMVGSVAKNSVSKSAADMSGRGIQNSATTRYKSVSDRFAQVPKSTANYRPAGVCSARPPTRTVPAASVTAGTRKTSVAPLRPSGNQGAKPKAPVTDKVKKPAASSSLSQYRLSMETAEERRAKLAEWLASKGKALKRPAIKTAAPSKTNVSVKPEADLKPQSHAELHLAEYCKAEPTEETQKPDPAVAAHDKNVQEVEQTANSQTAEIMNTTLDLLENSDADLPDDSQGGVYDIVVNLCDALEAMAIPSTCSDELVQVTDDVEMESKTVDECEKELQPEMSEDFCEKPKVEHVTNEECSDQKVEYEEESDESVQETPPPPMTDASVIRYSVKTTPYLQSVKKTIEEEVNTSTSRRASNIKDLKFLTPVRRSTRIQRKSSRLPTMLVDHDPCVSSLAELVKLDDDSNAYIYRKNPALLDNLPDQDNI